MGALGEGRWTVDPAGSRARFRSATLWGLAPVEGEIPVEGGTVEVRAGGVAGEILLAASELDTGLGLRDGHLRSDRFLNVERHPRIAFRPAAVDDGEVRGTLTVGDAKREVTLAVTADGDGEERIVHWETTVDRHALGVRWDLLRIIPADVALTGHARLLLEGPCDDG